jgi:hypothetical protein
MQPWRRAGMVSSTQPSSTTSSSRLETPPTLATKASLSQTQTTLASTTRSSARIPASSPIRHTNGPSCTRVTERRRRSCRACVSPAGIPDDTTNFYNGALKTTVTRFLSAFTIRVDAKNLAVSADNITGVDWASSQMAPISSVAGVSVPLLTTGNTRHYEYLSAEKIYLAATKTTDKIIAFVEGAQHTINTCTECETYPGEFGDMIRTAFDYMDVWLGKPGRFISA